LYKTVGQVFTVNCCQKSDCSSWDSVGCLGPDSRHQGQKFFTELCRNLLKFQM